MDEGQTLKQIVEESFESMRPEVEPLLQANPNFKYTLNLQSFDYEPEFKHEGGLDRPNHLREKILKPLIKNAIDSIQASNDPARYDSIEVTLEVKKAPKKEGEENAPLWYEITITDNGPERNLKKAFTNVEEMMQRKARDVDKNSRYVHGMLTYNGEKGKIFSYIIQVGANKEPFRTM